TTEQFEALLLAVGESAPGRSDGSGDGFVRALYRDVLQRTASPAEAAAWDAALAQAPGARYSVALAFVSSPERHADQVEQFYQRFRHRAADPGGLVVETDALDAGLPEEGVVATLVGSPEYLALHTALAQQPPVLTVLGPAAGTLTNSVVTVTGRASADE